VRASISLQELLSKSLDAEYNDAWEREQTATPVRAFAVRLHSAGLSLRERAAILDLLGVDRSYQAIWQWTHRLADSGNDPPTASPSRVAVDETAVQIAGERCWVYTAIDLDTMLVLDIEVFSRHGIDPAAAFLHRLTEKHNLDETTFLVDGYGYSTALA